MQFANLDRWTPASYTNERWCWPDSVVLPLSSVLQPQVSALDKANHGVICLATLHFDGSLEPRNGDAKAIKGRLFLAEPGDVVYSKIDVRNGAIGIIPDELGSTAFTAEFPIYRLNSERALAQYIKLVFRSRSFRRTINGMVTGASGRKRVMPSDLLRVEVPIPPLDTQRAIVEHWTNAQNLASQVEAEAIRIEERASFDFLRALGLNAPEERVRKRVFARNWSQIERWGSEVNQPASELDVRRSTYPVVTLSEVLADLENGWSPRCLGRPAVDGEWGVLKMGAVSFGRFNMQENKALPAALRPIPRLEVHVGDWLISRANITRLVGACSFVEATQPRLMLCDKIFRAVWRAPSPVAPRYLDAVLKTPHLRRQIEHSLTGSSPTMKNISKPALLRLEIPLPPLPLQIDLVACLVQARERADALREQARVLREKNLFETEAMILGKLDPPIEHPRPI